MIPRPPGSSDVPDPPRRVRIPVLHPDGYQVEDGDTDDRWASAALLSYFGLLLLVAVVLAFNLWTPASRTEPEDRSFQRARASTLEPRVFHHSPDRPGLSALRA